MSSGKDKPHLPHGWKVHQSTSYPDMVYYYNRITKVSSWECPQLISPADSSQAQANKQFPSLLAKPPAFIQEKLSRETKPSETVSATSMLNSKNWPTTPPVPKILPKSPPWSIKASSPPCVSSSSEIALSFETPSTRVESERVSPKRRRRIIRPILTPPSGGNTNSSDNMSKAKDKSASGGGSSSITPIVVKNFRYKSASGSADSSTNNTVNNTKQKPISVAKNKNHTVNNRYKSAPSGAGVSKTTTVNNLRYKPYRNDGEGAAAPSRKHHQTKVISLLPQSKQSPSATVTLSSTSLSAKNVNHISHQRYSPTKNNRISSIYNLDVAQNKTPVEPGSSTRQHFIEKNVPDYSSDVEMLDLSNDNANSNSQGYTIIVDTNVLMSNLKFIDELKDSPLAGCGPPIIIVPWVVLQELDGIKNDNDKKSEKVQKANEAVRYIYQMLAAKHPRFCGQNSLENPRALEGSLNPSCNDDLILNCCLQILRKVPQDKVVLLTNDKNLCNKAMVHSIQAYTADTLLLHLKVDFLPVSTAPAYAMSCNISVPSELSQSEENLRTEVDRIMIITKSTLKSCLSEFLEREMISAYKDDMWLTVVHLKPPWSLLDIVTCLNRHWIAVFTFVLSRKMKKCIEKMHNVLKLAKGYIYDEEKALELVSGGLSLCTEVADKGSAKAKEAVDKLVLLHQQLLCLGKNNISSGTSGDKNQRLPVSPPHRLSSDGLLPELQPNLQISQKVVQLFQHVWHILNHICGTVLDSLGWPHKLEYERPPSLPSKEETDKFIPVLYPELQELRKYMMSVVSTKETCDDKLTHNISRFYKQMLAVLPALNVQEPLPVSITEEEFRVFCTNPENKELLQGGLKQLLQFFALIHKSIRGTANQKTESQK